MNRSLTGKGFVRRLLLCALLGSAAAPVCADQYGYDELGNVQTLTSPRGTRTYTYDEIQRLDTETGYTGNRDHAYDLNGNRATDGAASPGTPTSATYTANTNRIATIDGAAVSLDAAGQITNDGLNTYTWDDAGRLKTVSRSGTLRATYHYDHKHRRTRKVSTAAAPQGAKTLVYHYDDQDRLIAETTETGAPVRSYLWADATLLAQVEYTLNATTGLYTVSRELLFELDHLGTPRQARLTGGSTVWRWESDGYGNTPPDEDPDGNGQKTYVYLRFPGQYYDEESGLHYNWHRYYSPKLGRYLSSDPIGIAGGRNSYGYVKANPLRYIDPTGLLCIYNQATGSTVCQSDSTGEIYYNERGYAGTGWGRDDSSAQGQQSVGPIPRGDWRTSDPYNSPNTGPSTIRLTPLPGNTCFDTGRDCSSFRIHGNNARNDASHGCIILPRNRTEIPAGETIRVISGDD